jgi:hypothetical protein
MRQWPKAVTDVPAAEPEVDEPAVAAVVDEPDTDDALVIPFEVNSSYFGRPKAQPPHELVQAMETDGRYRVELIATVAAGTVRGAETPEEKLRYNRWMAERRIERIEEWLTRNAPSELEIGHDLLEDDPTRRVLVWVRPLG